MQGKSTGISSNLFKIKYLQFQQELFSKSSKILNRNLFILNNLIAIQESILLNNNNNNNELNLKYSQSLNEFLFDYYENISECFKIFNEEKNYICEELDQQRRILFISLQKIYFCLLKVIFYILSFKNKEIEEQIKILNKNLIIDEFKFENIKDHCIIIIIFILNPFINFHNLFLISIIKFSFSNENNFCNILYKERIIKLLIYFLNKKLTNSKKLEEIFIDFIKTKKLNYNYGCCTFIIDFINYYHKNNREIIYYHKLNFLQVKLFFPNI
jgi:hypothetical protein